MACVYILQSIKNGKFYIGSTVNLKNRLLHHKSGGTPSTKRLGSIDLVFSQEYPTLKEARSVEYKLKRRDYIEKIISEGIIKITPSVRP